MTIETILCPIDLSEFSKPVLAHAAVLSRWYQQRPAFSGPCPLGR